MFNEHAADIDNRRSINCYLAQEALMVSQLNHSIVESDFLFFMFAGEIDIAKGQIFAKFFQK